MPPMPVEYESRDVAAGWLAAFGRTEHSRRKNTSHRDSEAPASGPRRNGSDLLADERAQRHKALPLNLSHSRSAAYGWLRSDGTGHLGSGGRRIVRGRARHGDPGWRPSRAAPAKRPAGAAPAKRPAGAAPAGRRP